MRKRAGYLLLKVAMRLLRCHPQCVTFAQYPTFEAAVEAARLRSTHESVVHSVTLASRTGDALVDACESWCGEPPA